MRVVVVGASGNVGTSVLRSLAAEDRVEMVVGIARRRPQASFPKTEWAQADVRSDELVPLFRGADAVVHLAWAIQPSRDEAVLRRTNVEGSNRVFRAVADAGVPALVYASSVGAYSPGPKNRLVDEGWPTDGIPASFYSRHKSEVERALDRFERERPEIRVVRMRPGLIFKRGAASGIRRLFVGPLLPSPLLRRALLPVVPAERRLRFQAVHSHDVGEAYRAALLADVRGPFNVAADPVLDGSLLAEAAGARALTVPRGTLRLAADVTWRLRLQPTPPGWVDLGLGVPLMDTSRARTELGWSPEHTATSALAELVEGLRDRAGLETPPLAPETGGPARIEEIRTGLGEREAL